MRRGPAGGDPARKEHPTLRALITGAGGFAGSHLAEHLLAEGDEVHGVLSPRGDAHNLAGCAGRCHLVSADLLDAAAVRDLLEATAPDAVYHLAARASVPAAWRDPAATLVNNTVAQINVLQGLVDLGAAPRVLVVASSDEYGRVRPEDLPVDEETPLRPVNPYAVSKVAQDYAGLQYYLSHALPVVRVRPFNHTGPRQETGFVVADFASQIAAIEHGDQPPVLHVGNLTAERDLSDVRDIVRAYRAALLQGEPGQVYNIGSCRALAVRTLLDRLLALSRVPIAVQHDPARMRPSDIPRVVADCSRLRAATGWEPVWPLEKTLSDTLDHWRARIAGQTA